MEQYLQALREREDVSEEVLLKLEDRFKVVEEEPIIVPVEPTAIELLQQENLFLKEQVRAVSEIADFHEELIVELATMLY